MFHYLPKFAQVAQIFGPPTVPVHGVSDICSGAGVSRALPGWRARRPPHYLPVHGKVRAAGTRCSLSYRLFWIASYVRVAFALAASVTRAAALGMPVAIDADKLAPGLVAEYRPFADGADPLLSRLELKPAFTLFDSSLHPRLPPGAFAARWTGLFDWRETE